MIGFLDDMFRVHLYYAGQIEKDFQPPVEKPPQMAVGRQQIRLSRFREVAAGKQTAS